MKQEEQILFPAFVSLFVNDSKKSCIYYFRGLTTTDKFIYQEFNEDQLPKNYIKHINDDKSIQYEFNSNISAINCHLISNCEDFNDEIICINYKN